VDEVETVLGLEDWKFIVVAENRVDTEARSSNPSIMSFSSSGTGAACVIWTREGGSSEPKTCNVL
jgi:hypothetical protein